MKKIVLALSCSLLCSMSLGVVAQSANDKEARDIFKLRIEINTTDSVGSVTRPPRRCGSDWMMPAS